MPKTRNFLLLGTWSKKEEKMIKRGKKEEEILLLYIYEV